VRVAEGIDLYSRLRGVGTVKGASWN